MKLTTKELLQATTILLNYIEKKGYNTISFSNEDSYYQKIWHADRNLNNTPEITIGILDEDIETIKKILQGTQPFEYDLERLGAIFTVLGAILSRK